MRMVGGKTFSFARSWSFFGLNRPSQKTGLNVNLEPAQESEETLQFCADIKRTTVGLGGAAFVQQEQLKNISVSFQVKSFSEETKQVVFTIQVTGPFITKLLKEYRKPLKMGVRAVLYDHTPIFVVCDVKMECKDMYSTSTTNLAGRSYRFEKDFEAPWFAELVSSASQPQLRPALVLDSGSSQSQIEVEIWIKLIGDPESILGWVPPGDNEQLCRKFLEENQLTDFTLISEDNEEFPCHKLFLGGHSPVFAAMFRTENEGMSENKSCKLESSKESIEAFLKFLYYSNVDVPQDNSGVALELLNLGHQYMIGTLENSMKRILLGKPVEWFDKEVALLLFIRARKLDDNDDYEPLKERAVEVIRAKGTELKSSSVMDEIFKEDRESAKELVVLLSDKR